MPRPFATSTADVVLEDGTTYAKVPTVIRGDSMKITVNGSVIERRVLSYDVQGRTATVQTDLGTVTARRSGGCNCR